MLIVNSQNKVYYFLPISTDNTLKVEKKIANLKKLPDLPHILVKDFRKLMELFMLRWMRSMMSSLLPKGLIFNFLAMSLTALACVQRNSRNENKRSMDLGALLDTCDWCDKLQISADLFYSNIWVSSFTRYKASESE